jgi:uncharacterized membrane protein YkoI
MKKIAYVLAIAMLFAPILTVWGKEHEDNYLTQAMAFGRAQVSLQDVISSVEKTSGGRVVEVEIEDQCKLLSSKSGVPMYEVESVKDSALTKYYVDGTTGKIIDQKRSWWSALDLDAPWKSAKFAKVKLSIVQAVATAEQATGGKAMSAKLKGRHGDVFYMIRTVVDGNVKVVLVDPENGKAYQTPLARHTGYDHEKE